MSLPLQQELVLLKRGLRMFGMAARRTSTAVASLALLDALLPAASVWLLKQVIDVVAAARGSAPSRTALGAALVLAGCYLLVIVLQQALRSLSYFLNAQVNDELAGYTTLRLMEKASAYPDLSLFESPHFHDRLQLLQREVDYRPMCLFTGLAQMAQSSVTLACMMLFLLRFHPLLPVALAVTAGPGLFLQRRLRQNAWWGQADVVPLRRWLTSYAAVLLTVPFAKEVRLYGFADHFLTCYREGYRELITRLGETRWRLVSASIGLALLTALGVGGGFAFVINKALHGAVTLGDLTLYTGALLQASGAAGALAGALALVHDALPFFRELFAFLDARPAMLHPANSSGNRAGGGRLAAASYPLRSTRYSRAEGFRFESVRFAYPDTERPVFKKLDLEIPWGKTTAIVGENGAGKSTLVKLLTRLYDPVSGRILLNGTDLRELDLEELRRQIAVVFQEFARYPMSVSENVGLGDIHHLHDRGRIGEAIRRAGADGLIRRLPQGEETLLGREFEGGVELSGGEWQKVALARAFMRTAPILILDEPTAALDARAENELYHRFVELAAGRTTLLISHRFSTVRMADRILVLEAGAVVEEGDHLALVARGGRYAELYAMQAERYRL